MNNQEHTLVLVVGRTGSGKSSLINKLCERTGLKPLISQTTRPRRNEADNDHNFVSKEEYFRAKANGEIAVDAEIAGNYYYSTVEQLYNADLYTLNPKAVEKLKALNLPNLRLIVVYISCPDELREGRTVHKRGDDRITYRERNHSERMQFRSFVAEEEWDYSIKNIDFPKAYSVLKWICDIEGLWKNEE